MKKVTLTLYFLCALIVSSFAQSNTSNPVVEKVSADLSKIMADDLALNEVDYLKVKALNHDRITNAAEAEKRYADDEAMLSSRLKEIEEEYEEKLFKMLNGRQVAAYSQFKEKPEANFLSLMKKVSTERR